MDRNKKSCKLINYFFKQKWVKICGSPGDYQDILAYRKAWILLLIFQILAVVFSILYSFFNYELCIICSLNIEFISAILLILTIGSTIDYYNYKKKDKKMKKIIIVLLNIFFFNSCEEINKTKRAEKQLLQQGTDRIKLKAEYTDENLRCHIYEIDGKEYLVTSEWYNVIKMKEKNDEK